MEKVAEQGQELMGQVCNLSELADKVHESSKKCGQTKIVVIDGPAGSGKTTLANSLSGLLENCPIIHMDEIYEGWENALSLKTFSDLASWIIKPLLESKSIEETKQSNGLDIEIVYSNYQREQKALVEAEKVYSIPRFA